MNRLLSIVLALFLCFPAVWAEPVDKELAMEKADEVEGELTFDTHYYRHELSIGIGGMLRLRNDATKSVVERVCKNFDGVYEGGMLSGSNGNPYFGADGAFAFDYYCHLNKDIAIGVHAGRTWSDADIRKLESVPSGKQYNPETGQTEDFYEKKAGAIIGAVNVRSFFLMPSLKWSWSNLPWCSFYSKATAGMHKQRIWYEGYGILANRNRGYERSITEWAWAVVPFGWEIGHKHVRGFMEFGGGSSIFVHVGLTYRFGAF